MEQHTSGNDEKWDAAPLWAKASMMAVAAVIVPMQWLQRRRDLRDGTIVVRKASVAGYDTMLNRYAVGDLVEQNMRTGSTRVVK